MLNVVWARSLSLVMLLSVLGFAASVRGGEIPFDVLKNFGPRWAPRVLVDMGLKHDRQWVLEQLLWIVEHDGDSGRRLTSLNFLDEHGDYTTVDALDAIALRLRTPGRARAVRDTSRVIRARLMTDPHAKYHHWLGVLESGTGSELIDAVDALGELGDIRAKSVLLRVSLEVAEAKKLVFAGKGDPQQHRFQKWGAVPSNLQRRIQLALEKIHLLSTSPAVGAYARAAQGDPRKELAETPGIDPCPLKLWGIRKLGNLGTPIAQTHLMKIFEEYEAHFKNLVLAAKGKEQNAYKMFRAGNANDYFYQAYNALKKSGLDVLRERRVAGADTLLRLQ